MEITLSVDEAVVVQARKRAESMGTSVDQLVRSYLEQLATPLHPEEDADGFVRLSQMARGDSKGWKFNRDELHERR